MRLLVATGNAGKLRELRALLGEHGIEVIGLDQFPEIPPVVEDGETFADNARKKALTVSRASQLLTLADDSGLTVKVLGGAPGVHSARFAGPDASDADNNRKLLEELKDCADPDRSAAFICVLALARPDGTCHFYEGRLPGEIIATPRGCDGFGYDPLFFLPQRQCTLAELPLEEKNRISHRGQALEKLLKHLSSLEG
ncbi:MAG: non-canonical purine NTP pyrophosphatase [Desulfuromonas sp.]|nr:MAG: non-canonical purine NTP pyrophosphatase [Desulfuromonas sp.]